MKKFSELPLIAQLGIFAIIPAILWGVSEYLYYPLATPPSGTMQEMQVANAANQDKLTKLENENKVNKKIEKDYAQLLVETKASEAKLESLKSIVPTDKDTEGFIKMVRGSGDMAGVNVRRFTPLAVAKKEFYSEMPFEIEIDGTWHSAMVFFDRVGKMSRIANISNLGIGPKAATVKGVKRKYDYAPSETIVAGCIVTTFFRPPDPKDQMKGPAPAAPAAAPAKK